MKKIEMIGRVFGRIVVLREAEKDNNLSSTHQRYWCKCSCGVEKSINGRYLRSGETKSCGCDRGVQKIYENTKIRDRLWIENNKEKCKGYSREWRMKNKPKLAEYSSKWRVSFRKSIPAWAEQEKMDLVYKKAQKLKMTVDHVVPLRSPLVCGLHVWSNLQLMDKQLNCQKSNRVWPDMPDYGVRLPDSTLQALSA
jgi:hypothetical protein